jgi:hypothetical protein
MKTDVFGVTRSLLADAILQNSSPDGLRDPSDSRGNRLPNKESCSDSSQNIRLSVGDNSVSYPSSLAESDSFQKTKLRAT